MNRPTATKITVHYEDGTLRELNAGLAVELTEQELISDMVHFSPLDLVRTAYGLLTVIDRLGMSDLLARFADGVDIEAMEEELDQEGGTADEV
ncbi:hypothetical protein [Hungatella effluvii]|uniref:hypothetical protein n=1 Tax=Hungatella effluvii TaxID=1096246 RepID=UPI0022E4691D|nr:hypothetical protein [Hungatella effluvii]